MRQLKTIPMYDCPSVVQIRYSSDGEWLTVARCYSTVLLRQQYEQYSQSFPGNCRMMKADCKVIVHKEEWTATEEITL